VTGGTSNRDSCKKIAPFGRLFLLAERLAVGGALDPQVLFALFLP